MSQNVPKLTSKQIQAAALLAADEISDEAIAERLGVARKTLQRWRELPDFLDAMADHNHRVETAMLRLDIAKRHKRVAILNDLQNKMLTVIDERAAHYQVIEIENAITETDQRRMARVAAEMFGTTDETVVPPGGTTGIVVRQLKMVGSGMSAKIVEEFAVDTGLIKELRANQEQAAKELGQWVDRSEQSGSLTSRVQIVGIDEGDI